MDTSNIEKEIYRIQVFSHGENEIVTVKKIRMLLSALGLEQMQLFSVVSITLIWQLRFLAMIKSIKLNWNREFI